MLCSLIAWLKHNLVGNTADILCGTAELYHEFHDVVADSQRQYIIFLMESSVLFGPRCAKAYFRAYVGSEGQDQTARSRSLIRAFTIC